MSDITRSRTEIAAHGTFIHDADLLAEQMTRTRADLYTEVTTRLDGDGITGLSKLRKHELAAMVADWATGTRDNERESAARSAAPTAAQRLVRLQAEAAKSGQPCCSLWSRGVDCMCADAAADQATGFEMDDDELEPVSLPAPVKTAGEVYRGKAPMLYDNVESQQLLVLGTGGSPIGGSVMRYLRENDPADREPRFLGSNRLKTNMDGRYTALCGHGYTQHDSCPSCDHVDNEIHERATIAGTHLSDSIGNGASIELGIVVFHADCTRSAITPDGDIVVRHANGNSWKTAHRALVLEHRRNAHRLALSENESRKPVAYDIDAELLGNVADPLDAYNAVINKAVRTLVSYGVTTAEGFMSLAGKLIDEDQPSTKPHTFQDSIDEIKRVGRHYPDGVNFVADPPITGEQVIHLPTMTAAEAFDVIDFTHPDFDENQS